MRIGERKMKKILALLLILVMVCSLWGCEDSLDPTGTTGMNNPGTTKPSTAPSAPGSGSVSDNPVHAKDSYTGSNEAVLASRDDVVATFNGVELTNAQLQLYYWYEVYDFVNEYSYYLGYLGFDYTKSLDSQVCAFDKTVTWQKYFLQGALSNWQRNVALAQLAEAADYQLPQSYRNELDSLPQLLETSAKLNGYASVDLMVQATFGYGLTLNDYLQYMELYYYGFSYFADLYESIQPTMEEIEAYFDENEEALEAQGIKKDGTFTIDVRHILVLIDNVVSDAGDSGQATDAHWAA